MYALKTIPEDFIVVELPSREKNGSGSHLYFTLRKRNWNTLDAVKQIAQILHINLKNMGFAGSKDKIAVTEQLISCMGRSKEQIVGLRIVGISLEYYGAGNEPINLGDFEGNFFEIVVRNLDENFKANSIEQINYCENYFDEQRFSSGNVEIGRLIVKKKFKEAVKLMDREKVQNYLKSKKNDAIGAMRLLPMRLLRMYVSAYQSYLWNETVKRFLEKQGTVKKINYSLGELAFTNKIDRSLQIPLIGWGSAEIENDEIKMIIKEIMNEEQLYYGDFIIKQIPQLSLEGEVRDVFTKIKDFKIQKLEDDDLNSGKKKITVSFTLRSGSYATMVIKRLIEIEDMI